MLGAPKIFGGHKMDHLKTIGLQLCDCVARNACW